MLFEKLQGAKRDERAQAWLVDSRISVTTKELLEKRAMKRDNIRDVECNLLSRYIRKRLREDFEAR